jgi:hypothetical protein
LSRYARDEVLLRDDMLRDFRISPTENIEPCNGKIKMTKKKSMSGVNRKT